MPLISFYRFYFSESLLFSFDHMKPVVVGSPGQMSTSTLILHNPTNDLIAFKVDSSSSNYGVTPSSGRLSRYETKTVKGEYIPEYTH